jgi:hypothetical protein
MHAVSDLDRYYAYQLIQWRFFLHQRKTAPGPSFHLADLNVSYGLQSLTGTDQYNSQIIARSMAFSFRPKRIRELYFQQFIENANKYGPTSLEFL